LFIYSHSEERILIETSLQGVPACKMELAKSDEKQEGNCGVYIKSSLQENTHIVKNLFYKKSVNKLI